MQEEEIKAVIDKLIMKKIFSVEVHPDMVEIKFFEGEKLTIRPMLLSGIMVTAFETSGGRFDLLNK